jgi:hypothetical protein
MFLGAGAVPGVTEVFGGIGGQIDPSMAAAETTPQRQALRQLVFAARALREGSRTLAADIGVLDSLTPSLGPLENPVSAAQKTIDLYDFLTKRRTDLQGVRNDQTRSMQARGDADKDLIDIDKVFSAMPPRDAMVKRLEALKAGTGGQATPGAVVEEAKGAIDKAKGAAGGAAGGQKPITGMTLEELNTLDMTKLSTEQLLQASERWKLLTGGAK